MSLSCLHENVKRKLKNAPNVPNVPQKSLKNSRKWARFWCPRKCHKIEQTFDILTPFLTELGFSGNSYIKNYKKEDQLAYPMHLLKFNHMPFIRVKTLSEPEENLRQSLLGFNSEIKKHGDYNPQMIEKHLNEDNLFLKLGMPYYATKTAKSLKNKVKNWFLG